VKVGPLSPCGRISLILYHYRSPLFSDEMLGNEAFLPPPVYQPFDFFFAVSEFVPLAPPCPLQRMRDFTGHCLGVFERPSPFPSFARPSLSPCLRHVLQYLVPSVAKGAFPRCPKRYPLAPPPPVLWLGGGPFWGGALCDDICSEVACRSLFGPPHWS